MRHEQQETIDPPDCSPAQFAMFDAIGSQAAAASSNVMPSCLRMFFSALTKSHL
jgi:hypothetical protein